VEEESATIGFKFLTVQRLRRKGKKLKDPDQNFFRRRRISEEVDSHTETGRKDRTLHRTLFRTNLSMASKSSFSSQKTAVI